MVNNPLEFLAAKYGNVVKYDAEGNPSVFVKFPKMKSKDLDDSLPDHIHPAFIINGEEQDYILLGKYKGSCLNGTQTGTVYSLPNMPPVHTRGADELLKQCRAFGGGVSGMTVADQGFLLLLAQKMGWDPGGNTDYGHCYKTGSRYELGKAVTAGTTKGFRGWLYKCKVAHTTCVELYPDVAPTHWEKLRRIGGVEAYPTLHDNGQRNLLLTLTGSGPMDWYLDGTPASMADVVGNQYEQSYGYRIVAGEIQILPDNDAADETADLSASSRAWKAILPNAADDSYTLVAPGTAGTLHWSWANGKITLDTASSELDNQYRGTSFKDLAVNAEHLPFVPSIVRELGLLPTKGSTTKGYYYMQMTQDERFPRRGGGYSNGGNAGLGYVGSNYPRGRGYWNYGVRPRSRP